MKKNTFVDGWNEMQWDCEKQECWNRKCRAPIHFFSGAIPRKMGMSDIDMTAEVGGHFLFCEFKAGPPRAVPVGQRIYAEHITGQPKSIAFVVAAHVPGDPMAITHITIFRNGRVHKTIECTATELYQLIEKWSVRCDGKTDLKAAL